MPQLSIKKITDILLRSSLISESQKKYILETADKQFKKLSAVNSLKIPSVASDNIVHGVSPVDVIVSLKLSVPGKKDSVLTEEVIIKALARYLGFPFKKIDPLELDLDVVTKTIPRLFALKHLVVPVGIAEGRLEVVMYNPSDAEVINDIRRVTTMEVVPAMGTKSDILKIINEFFGFKSSILAAETQLAPPSMDLGNLEHYTRLQSIKEIQSTDSHIKNALDYLFHYAFEQKASDVHIEPKRGVTLIRLRIDGILHTIYRLPKAVHAAIISRIKALAHLDISEKRRPQDGRIKISHQDREAEIRVSTIPVAFGEKAVLRILDPRILFQDLEDLGFSSRDLVVYHRFLREPNGIILVTGPTGSGKSTTLYSSLNFLSSPEKNLISIEDPVEMIHEDFNQIAVQPVIGITFATILRNILRQDPDIIMVGEIRDEETAENAIQAALTGHLVLSTLHTNNAPSTITRLINLGVKPFLITESLIGVVAQRLLRRICPYCLQTIEVEREVLLPLGVARDKPGSIQLKQGRGCVQCRGTGYLGRTGVFEVMPLDDGLKQVISEEADILSIRNKALESGMVTLRMNAIDKMFKGITTYQEVMRVTPQA
nr:type II/IV secretion system protein [Desulfobacterales bacterium]